MDKKPKESKIQLSLNVKTLTSNEAQLASLDLSQNYRLKLKTRMVAQRPKAAKELRLQKLSVVKI